VGPFGDGGHLCRAIGGWQVHVRRQIFPGAGGARHVRLSAEPTFHAHFARHAGHLIGEGGEGGRHAIDGFGERRHFTFGFHGDALAQIAVGAANFLFVAATLYHLLGEGADVSFLTFASFYCAANVMSIVSHIPGGFGVLEAVVLAAAPGPDTVRALILFRLLYYAAPFGLGAVLYGGFELLGSRGRFAQSDAGHDG